jgi:eukaryotic-like serine/threonine-protein kinase
MSSEAVSSFLEIARVHRLLPTHVLDGLVREQDDFSNSAWELKLAELVVGEELTSYQAELIRSDRSDALLFAYYPVLDYIGPAPGGREFRALHPSLRSPVVLRRYDTDRFANRDQSLDFVAAAQAASVLHHENLAELLDAGVSITGEVYVALSPFAGGTLDTLVQDIGPMPMEFALRYATSLTYALEAAHAKGLYHGDVNPKNILIGPLTPMSKPKADGSARYRPTSDATLKLFELGLTGITPGIERSVAADVCGLGVTLYYMLAGSVPSHSGSHLLKIRDDVPLTLSSMISRMIFAEAEAKPTLTEILAELTPQETSENMPQKPLASLVDDALASNSGIPKPQLMTTKELLDLSDASQEMLPGMYPRPETEDSGDDYPALPKLGQASTEPTYTPQEYIPTDDSTPRREVAPEGKSKLWLWLGVGIGLQVLAVLLWVGYFYIPFGGSSTAPTTKAVKRP